MLMRVLLPAPFSPTTAWMVTGRRIRLAPSRAATPGSDLLRCESSTTTSTDILHGHSAFIGVQAAEVREPRGVTGPVGPVALLPRGQGPFPNPLAERGFRRARRVTGPQGHRATRFRAA